MKGTDALLVALFTTSVIGSALSATTEKKPAGWNDPTSVQLTDYYQIHAALLSGIPVRYYMDIETSSGVTGTSRFSYGGVIDPFDTFNHIVDADLIVFSSQELSHDPVAATILRETQLGNYNVAVAIGTIWILNPATLLPYDKSEFNCPANNGTEGSGCAYFYVTTQQQPSLLPTFSDVYLTLHSGSTVQYSINFGTCNPSTVRAANGGGSISAFQDLNVTSSNRRMQFSVVHLNMNPIAGFDTTVISLDLNGIVNFDRKLQSTTFIPYWSQTLTCLINNGTNNGGVSFYSRKSEIRPKV